MKTMRFKGVDYPDNITLTELARELNNRGQFEDFAWRLKQNKQIADANKSAQSLIEELSREEKWKKRARVN